MEQPGKRKLGRPEMRVMCAVGDNMAMVEVTEEDAVSDNMAMVEATEEDAVSDNMAMVEVTEEDAEVRTTLR